ncbi:unnamed protein product, partial [Phaeothamnion confervicola]
PCELFPKCSGEYIDRGCKDGRVIGGLGSFDWWPIKAYRPCPAMLSAGYNYQRQGQTIDEVVFGS